MACRRVIKMGERVVKEFISQLPCYLTRIAIELHCLTDSGQEQGTMAKDDSTDTPKTHPIPQKS